MTQALDFEALMNGHQQATPQEPAGIHGQTGSALGENRYLSRPEDGLGLCAELIASGDTHTQTEQLLGQFSRVISERFLPHSKQADNMLAVDTYEQLLGLAKKLAEIVSFPHLESYHTIAVGGSFSAGKSRFLNSVLGCDSLLPTDTTPTTSIPTYITRGAEDAIHALNFYHKKTRIDQDGLKAICHSFSQKFGVTFSHLLQLISVERCEFRYPELVFLDTPGYSKADDIHDAARNTDENIARAHLGRADYLIWLVDQQNGTIPRHDIEFLQSLELSQPVLVVISKADKKPPAQIEAIIAAARQDLDQAEIAYHQVIGYSAQQHKEYSPTRQVLTDFLERVSQGKAGTAVLWQLNELFKPYVNGFDSRLHTLNLTSKTIKELVYEEQLDDTKKVHLQDLRQKNTQQVSACSQYKQEAIQINQVLAELIEQICQALSLKICRQPSPVAIARMQQKSDQVLVEYRFEALLKGDQTQLAKFADLTDVAGKISRVSAVGAFIDIGLDFEILITKNKLTQALGAGPLGELIVPQQPARVQILDNKKAVVRLELAQPQV
ncbi:dynamin family protein [Shewanella colwelliana]|uniref:dynamin family protein n=1 Tax=Shewanella colwelliana TaxID=23 RepID=UPI00048A73B4|nr:dynamin family protein [Shewanella colwelliana]